MSAYRAPFPEPCSPARAPAPSWVLACTYSTARMSPVDRVCWPCMLPSAQLPGLRCRGCCASWSNCARRRRPLPTCAISRPRCAVVACQPGLCRSRAGCDWCRWHGLAGVTVGCTSMACACGGVTCHPISSAKSCAAWIASTHGAPRSCTAAIRRKPRRCEAHCLRNCRGRMSAGFRCRQRHRRPCRKRRRGACPDAAPAGGVKLVSSFPRMV